VIVGLIGPSGCGKTTLVRTLIGIETPSDGEVRVFGEDPTRFSTSQRARFGYMPQLPVLFPNLSIWRNLNFVASMYGVPLTHRRKRLNHVLELVDLLPHKSKQLAKCSGGMQRRLALAATLVHDPELLYLDEPTAGVDPILRERFWSHFRSLRDQGRTIVVPTQYVNEAASCDLVAVIDRGQLVTVQPPPQLARAAFGGDLVSVSLHGGWLEREQLDDLRRQPYVRSVRWAEDGVRLVVDDAERDIAVLQHYFQQRGIGVGVIAPVDQNYDEVFFELIESRHRGTATAA
jgi:ABC-2 type transport system ATP-binding protein